MLTETLARDFTTDNVRTMYDAVKMSCRTLLNQESLSEKLELFRTKMRIVCLGDSVNKEVRKLVSCLFVCLFVCLFIYLFCLFS